MEDEPRAYRTGLAVLAGLLFLGGAAGLLRNNDVEVGTTRLVLSTVALVLGLWGTLTVLFGARRPPRSP